MNASKKVSEFPTPFEVTMTKLPSRYIKEFIYIEKTKEGLLRCKMITKPRCPTFERGWLPIKFLGDDAKKRLEYLVNKYDLKNGQQIEIKEEVFL